MNGRSGLVTFFLFLFLLVMIILQVLSMVQSDRLYERLNLLLDRLASDRAISKVQEKAKRADLPMEEYPGDEGDWLIWRLHAEPRSLNPISVEGGHAAHLICTGNIFERLFEYDIDTEGVKLKPWLAESYEMSNDGLEVTIRLRDDIYFSDGVPVTVDDVIFTYETIMNPGVDAANIRNYYQNFKEVVKIDNRTIKFIFNEVYWKTIEAFGIFDVLPKHIYQFDNPEEFNKRRSNPVGSGPYIFEKWDVGREIVLRRNENYWGRKPKIEKLVFRFIVNSVSALQALRSHEIDYMEPTSEQFVQMSSDEQFKSEFRCLSIWQPSEAYFFIGWNQARPFFKDRNVRLAMTYIIDRESIVKYLLSGNGKVVTGPFYIYGRQNNPDIEPWPYDPERAKELLDEAGWVDSDGDGIRDKDGIPFRFEFTYNVGSTNSERMAKLLKDEGIKVGIDIISDPVESSIFTERYNNRDFDSLILGWGGTIESDPYQIWHSSQIKGRGNNFVGFNNPEADAIIEEARRTLEPDKRYALYHLLHKILHEEQPYTFLFVRPEQHFLDKRFENIVIHKLGLNSHEWYVPREKQRYK
jgi:peptide/nickel transport system substrate-binding protein